MFFLIVKKNVFFQHKKNVFGDYWATTLMFRLKVNGGSLWIAPPENFGWHFISLSLSERNPTVRLPKLQERQICLSWL